MSTEVNIRTHEHQAWVVQVDETGKQVEAPEFVPPHTDHATFVFAGRSVRIDHVEAPPPKPKPEIDDDVQRT